MNNDDLIKRLRKARGFSKHRKMCQEAANVIEYLEIEAKDLEFTCFVGDPHKVTECPYVDRLADLEAENDELKEKLKDSFQGRLLNKLKKKDAKIAQAMAMLNVSNSVDSMVEHIQSQPAVDPIRAAGGCYCRECVNYYEYDDWDRCHQETYTAHECGIFNRDLGPDGFCSRGEPKKEVEE